MTPQEIAAGIVVGLVVLLVSGDVAIRPPRPGLFVMILYALALWLQSLACLVLGHDAPGDRCRRCRLPVKGKDDGMA